MKLDAFRTRFPERQVTAGRLKWGVIEAKGKKGAPTLVLVPDAQLFFRAHHRVRLETADFGALEAR